ncbi:hypothetical protein MKW98_020746 [Papaver atlanticum]|uniref:Uncharacterized protein n=1 Tax=Papaver atlanticum TaxID=357466 RepID=A0AAD4XXI1_9MAGN|nr:hypothetical protein MKW98_020746 [Papaver atlanticum]
MLQNYLMFILVSILAFQLCKAEDDNNKKGEIYQQCFKDCDDKCEAHHAHGYGEVFCHAKCNIPCEAKQEADDNLIATKDTTAFIHRSISKATTSPMQSTDVGLVALLGIFMLALYH